MSATPEVLDGLYEMRTLGVPVVASPHVERGVVYAFDSMDALGGRKIVMHPQTLLNLECRLVVRNGLKEAFPWLKL